MKEIYMKFSILLLCLVVGLSSWAEEVTVTWTAASGALGTTISTVDGTATGTIKTGDFSWNYTRKLVSLASGKSDYVAMSSGYLQLGSKNAGETLNFTTSEISGTIKQISVDCFSKDGAHSISASVGGVNYISESTPSASGNTVSGTGTSSGTISIDFSISSANALYIKTISVTYEEGGEATTIATPTITYTNKISDGVIYPNSKVTLACSTADATIKYSLETESEGGGATYASYTYDAPFTVAGKTNIITAWAEKDGVKSENATLTLTKATPTTIASLKELSTTSGASVTGVLENVIVTYAESNKAYIQDANRGLYIYGANSLTAGTRVSLSLAGTMKTYNGLVELIPTTINVVSSTEVTIPETEITIAALNENFAQYESMRMKIVEATTTAFSSKNATLTQGEATIAARAANADITATNGATVTVVGYPGLFNTTKQFNVLTQDDITETAAAEKQTPTITATYKTSMVVGDDDEYTVTYNGDGTLSIKSSDEDVAEAIIEGKDVVVSAKAAGSTTITISAPETDNYYAATKSYTLTVTEPIVGTYVTIDLTKNETTTATEEKLEWIKNVVTMTADKANSTTATNNYYPGTGQSYKSTRFYKNSSLTFTPATGVEFTSIIYTATTVDFANALAGSTWTNATATAKTDAAPYTVTITPTDGTKAVVATLGGTTGGSSVIITYTGEAPEEPEKESYIVTLNSCGNTINGEASYTVEEGKAVTLPTASCTKEEYVFKGWSATEQTVETTEIPTLVSSSYVPTASITLYPIFVKSVTTGATDTEIVWRAAELSEISESTEFLIVSNNENGYRWIKGGVTADAGYINGPKVPAVCVTDEGYILPSDDINDFKWYVTNEDGSYKFTSQSGRNLYNLGSGYTNNAVWNVTAKQDKYYSLEWMGNSSPYESKGEYLGLLVNNFTMTTAANSNIMFYIEDVVAVGGTTTKYYTSYPGAEPVFTLATLSLVAHNEDGYYATFSNDKVTFFPEDADVQCVCVDGGELVTISLDKTDAVIVSDDDIFNGYFVPASTGVLVYSTDPSVTYYTVDNKAVEALDEDVNMLRPASAAMTGDYKFYKLAYDDYTYKTGLGFYYGAENGGAFTCKAGTAYLAVPTSQAVKSFTLSGAATDIKNVETATKSVIYNLNGQRLNKMQKGINIVDGKKYFVK